MLSEFSRLDRSMLECMEIISIAVGKGIRVYTVKGGWQLADTIGSKVIVIVFSMAAETERDLISKRTRESLAAKKLAGIFLGRPMGPGKSKLDVYRTDIEAFLQNGSTQKFIAQGYQVKQATLSKWIKKNKIKRADICSGRCLGSREPSSQGKNSP